MRRWFTTLVLIAVLFMAVLLSLSLLATAHSPKVVAVGLFFLLTLGLGIFSVRAEKMTFASKAGLRVFFAFLFKALAAVTPMLVVHWVSTHLVERLTLPLQILILAVWGFLLAGGLILIARPASRRKLFESLERLGGFAPVVYSFDVLVISIVFFATASHILATHGYLDFLPGEHTDPGISNLTDFYLWHFMESVPLLDINETVRWKAPFKYESPGIGWILLLFKFAVIVPVVTAFRGYWLDRQEEQQVQPTEAGGGGGEVAQREILDLGSRGK